MAGLEYARTRRSGSVVMLQRLGNQMRETMTQARGRFGAGSEDTASKQARTVTTRNSLAVSRLMAGKGEGDGVRLPTPACLLIFPSGMLGATVRKLADSRAGLLNSREGQCTGRGDLISGPSLDAASQWQTCRVVGVATVGPVYEFVQVAGPVVVQGGH